MNVQRKALGRGLESLLSADIVKLPEGSPHPTIIPIDKIFPNRQQPREFFNEENLKDLASSIQKEGIIQPLVVSPAFDGRFELIAGERRLRAAKLAGLTEVPVVIRNVHEDKMLELALIENIQRDDLNRIEEAKGYLALGDRFGLNHADIAERVGKSREHVANTLRLLKLPKVVQEDVVQKRMNAGHARALLSLTSIEDQLYYREQILKSNLSVRDIEKMIQEKRGFRKKMHRSAKMHLSPQMKLLIDEMEKTLATKIRLKPSTIREGHGELIIEYYSWNDLDKVYRKLTATNQ